MDFPHSQYQKLDLMQLGATLVPNYTAFFSSFESQILTQYMQLLLLLELKIMSLLHNCIELFGLPIKNAALNVPNPIALIAALLFDTFS